MIFYAVMFRINPRWSNRLNKGLSIDAIGDIWSTISPVSLYSLKLFCNNLGHIIFAYNHYLRSSIIKSIANMIEVGHATEGLLLEVPL